MNRRTEVMRTRNEKYLSIGLLPGTLRLVLLLALALHGCAVQRTAPRAPSPVPKSTPPPGLEEPVMYSPKLGPAASLYSQAKVSLDQGRYHQAELDLERALRIEPRNGEYWYAMARVKYQQNLHNQAIQFCLKSKSLAGQNSELIRMNDALIAKARQQQSN